MAQSDLSQQQQDEALLQRFGYKQELRRSLGFISNFAVAFSYISVSTGTFSLFYLVNVRLLVSRGQAGKSPEDPR